MGNETVNTEDFIQQEEFRTEISCEISGAEYGDNLFSQLKIIYENYQLINIDTFILR